MIIVMPTCDTHVKAAEASTGLLGRYWPDHPPLHVLHDVGRQNDIAWLETLTRFLRGRPETAFLLLLDDYGLCASPRRDIIQRATDLLCEDPTAGMFALSWYPAHDRTPEKVGLKLGRFPILLQAAIWRVDWFLELASLVNPKCSSWGFETAATQAVKRCTRSVYAVEIPGSCRSGRLIDGLDKTHWPLPYHNLMHMGRWDESHFGFCIEHGIDVPSRGLGDTVAKLTASMGITQCGCCRERQAALNAAVPFTG